MVRIDPYYRNFSPDSSKLTPRLHHDIRYFRDNPEAENYPSTAKPVNPGHTRMPAAALAPLQTHQDCLRDDQGSRETRARRVDRGQTLGLPERGRKFCWVGQITIRTEEWRDSCARLKLREISTDLWYQVRTPSSSRRLAAHSWPRAAERRNQRMASSLSFPTPQPFSYIWPILYSA